MSENIADIVEKLWDAGTESGKFIQGIQDKLQEICNQNSDKLLDRLWETVDKEFPDMLRKNVKVLAVDGGGVEIYYWDETVENPALRTFSAQQFLDEAFYESDDGETLKLWIKAARKRLKQITKE